MFDRQQKEIFEVKWWPGEDTNVVNSHTHKICKSKGLKLYQGQGRRVKGQGQIGIFKQNFNELLIKNGMSDFDQTRVEC